MIQCTVWFSVLVVSGLITNEKFYVPWVIGANIECKVAILGFNFKNVRKVKVSIWPKVKQEVAFLIFRDKKEFNKVLKNSQCH